VPWWRRNDARLIAPIIARAYIVAVDRALVTLLVSYMWPGKVLLQLLLVLGARLAVLLGYAAIALDAAGHYTVSVAGKLCRGDSRRSEAAAGEWQAAVLEAQGRHSLRRVDDAVVKKSHAGVYRLVTTGSLLPTPPPPILPAST
jgi:hypothetical protein